MRDNHDGMPELTDAYERDGHCFAVVQLTLLDELCAFEFGVDRGGYSALRSLLTMRPYENTGLGPYRYFISGSYSRHSFFARIEQGREGRNFEIPAPDTLVKNLAWFFRLTDPEDASQLQRVAPRSEA